MKSMYLSHRRVSLAAAFVTLALVLLLGRGAVADCYVDEPFTCNYVLVQRTCDQVECRPLDGGGFGCPNSATQIEKAGPYPNVRSAAGGEPGKDNIQTPGQVPCMYAYPCQSRGQVGPNNCTVPMPGGTSYCKGDPDFTVPPTLGQWYNQRKTAGKDCVGVPLPNE